MEDVEEIHHQKEAKVLLGQDLSHLRDDGGPSSLSEKAFASGLRLGSKRRRWSMPVLRLQRRARRRPRRGLETEQDFQAVREEATEEGAGGGRFRKQKPTFVSSENLHKQGALGLPDEGERVSKAHKDTIS